MGAETSWPREATPRADDIPAEWLAEFEAAARRPLPTRFRYAFIHTYKPVLDDEPFRAFDTTADYRRWCEDIGKSGAILLEERVSCFPEAGVGPELHSKKYTPQRLKARASLPRAR